MNIKIMFLSVVMSCLFSSCSYREPEISPTSTQLLPGQVSATSTPLVNSSITQTATLMLSPTGLPVITADTSRAVLTEWLVTNGGCRLPCLLGLTPKDAGSPEASALQAYFEKIEYPLDVRDNNVGVQTSTWENGGGVWLVFWNEKTATNTTLDYYFMADRISQLVLTSWSNQHLDNGAIPLYDELSYKDLLTYYSLDNILTTYGLPSKVLIAPFPDDPGYPSPPAQYTFSTVLIYEQFGFLVQYGSIRERINAFYVGCPQYSHIDVSTWDPNTNIDLANAVKFFSGVDSINSSNIEYFQNIEDVTDFNIQKFYETFMSTDPKECIRTEIDHWKLP